MKTNWFNAEALVHIFLNGIHWDSSYTDNFLEALRWKKEAENKSVSIWNRVNNDALQQFIEEYHISNAELIEVTAEVIEL